MIRVTIVKFVGTFLSIVTQACASMIRLHRVTLRTRFKNMPKTSEKLNLIQHTTAQAEFAAELNSAPVTAYHEATVPIYENTSILEPA